MKLARAILVLSAALVAGGVWAQNSNLPAGLTQQGGVIMMQPIQDYDGADKGLTVSQERHAGRIHFFSGADHDLYSRAFDAADRGDWLGARALAAQGRDSAAKRLIDWRYLLDKNGGASFDEINAFLKANPDWPLRDTLYTRAEAVIDLNMTPQQVIAWFGSRAPVSGLGKIRLGEAMIATGKVQAGRDMIRDGWVKSSFEPDQELAIVQKDGAYLTPDLDRQRLNNLLWRDDVAGARRELARVTSDAQRIGTVRLALRASPASGEAQASSLPADLASDPDLTFDRARAARKAQSYAQGEALLIRFLNQSSDRTRSAKIWGEADILSREALKSGDYRTAFRIADATRFAPGGDEFSDAEFMAGWVALRFLKDPKSAQPHFQRLEAGVSRPISLARAHYWQGRAYEALGDNANAWEQYRLAAKYPVAFYGQVAAARIDATPTLHIDAMPPDTQTGKADFEQEDLTHVMKVLADLGQVSLLRTFAMRSAEARPDARHYALLCQALVDMGFREIAVRVAKQASYDGFLYLAYTHPTIPVPAYQGPGAGPEPAVVLGLIRQETEFDPAAISAPGARGIMQLMPASAKAAAASAGLPYRPNDLLTDVTYNMQLGMAEFGGDLNDWSGSLAIAAAAYNAGPSNARKWLNNNGDPRSPASDPIDWIEQIPFKETRNYVMRVLENTQVYRNRIAGRDQPLRITADLYMPNPAPPPPARIVNYTPPPPAPVVVVPKPKPRAK